MADPPPRARQGGVTHTAPSKYRDEIISLVFFHTKYGEPIVIMVFRRAIQKVHCLSPPAPAARLERADLPDRSALGHQHRHLRRPRGRRRKDLRGRARAHPRGLRARALEGERGLRDVGRRDRRRARAHPAVRHGLRRRRRYAPRHLPLKVIEPRIKWRDSHFQKYDSRHLIRDSRVSPPAPLGMVPRVFAAKPCVGWSAARPRRLDEMPSRLDGMSRCLDGMLVPPRSSHRR
jgi:hypothetical protein